MTKKDYLDMRGFSALDWNVFEKEIANGYLEKQGAMNNMYPVKEAPAKKAFGQGAYIIKIEWITKHGFVEGSETKTPEPLVSNVPPPVPPVTAEPIKEPVIEPQEEISDFLKVRIGKLIALGYKASPGKNSLKGPEGQFLTHKEIDDMENAEWDSYILVKPKEEIPAKVIEQFNCDKFENTGQECEEQCSHCKSQDSVDSNTDVVVELENPIKLRIERLEKMGYELVDDFYKKFYADGKKWFGIKESYVLESDALTFVEYLKNLEKQEADIVSEETVVIDGKAESTFHAEAIAETHGEMSEEDATKLGEETRKKLIDEGKIDDAYDLVKSDARKADLESVGAVKQNDRMVKGLIYITYFDMYNVEDSKWPDTIKEFDDHNPQTLSPETVIEGLEKETTTPEKEDKKVKVETKVSKPEIGEGDCAVGPSATDLRKDELIENMNFIDKLSNVFTAYSTYVYVIVQIKKTMSSDLTPGKKIKEIESHLDKL